MSGYKEIAARESCFRPGSTLCPGCMEAIAFQNLGRVTDNGTKTVFTIGTSCAEVSTLFFPNVVAWGRGDAPPDDYRQHMLRARALSGLKMLDEATVEYETALRLRPDDQQIRLELHRNRAQNCVERGNWSAAAAEWAAAIQLRPDDSYLWRFQAVTELADGSVDAYQRTCEKMLDRFGSTEESVVAANVLLVCTLQEKADAATLMRLAQVAEPVWHWGAWARGSAP